MSASAPGARVSIDAIAEAIDTLAISQVEIEALFDALEAAGREVWAPQGAGGVGRLASVLRAARELRASTGKTPSPDAIALALSLPLTEVHQALLLGKIMGR